MDQLCYQYRYDERGRLIEKKLPGKGWEYMVYNKLDQVVASQDSVQRMKTPLQEASFTKYDAQGRTAMSGIFTVAGSTAGVNKRSVMQDSVNAQAVLWEARITTGTGYSVAVYPKANITPLSISYYDTYTSIPSKPTAFIAPADASTMTIGLLTATRTAVLGTPTNMLCSMMYYDDEGKIIKTFNQHYFGGTLNAGNYDETVINYNFTDQEIATTRKHYLASVLKVTIADSTDYDHMVRKIKSWRQLTNGTGLADAKILISKVDYNEVGQLKTKNLHSTEGTTFKQAVAYNYNERGWLQNSSAPLFAVQLKYTDGTAPQYNGNIANQLWGVPGALDKTYTYRYDNLNRLLSGASTTNDRERSILYDKMGNITNLTRFSNNVIIDSLNYNYTISGVATNQLQSVNDLTTSVLGQKPGSFTYTYDGNGNMLTDNSKGITIAYNMLNLPQGIAAKTTTYTYDASGNKLRRVTGTVATEYIDGIQYDSGTISFIKTDEGRALPNGTIAYNYEYTIGDNLGNSRVGFDIFNNAARLVQTNNYYPFGMEAFNNTASSPKNYYLYNKKELQGDIGLYDYGARFYDPIIARWQVVDPLSEIARRWSPYNYGENNPIRNIDPDGMAVIDGGGVNGGDLYTGIDAQNAFQQIKQELQVDDKDKKKAKSSPNKSVSTLSVKNAPRIKPVSHWWEYVFSFLNDGRDVNGVNYDNQGNPVHFSNVKLEMPMWAGPGAAEELPYIGQKLKYLFGEASGNLHNVERSTTMLRQLESVGIFNNAEGKAYIAEKLSEVYKASRGVVQANGRVLRASVVMGPNGGLKMESIWEGSKLITVKLIGGR